MPKRKWFSLNRKKIIIFLSVLFIFVLVVVGFFFLLQRTRKADEGRYREKVEVVWSEIVSKSQALEASFAKVKERRDLKLFALRISRLKEAMEEKQKEVNSLSVPKKYNKTQEKLKEGLTSYIDYLGEAENIAQKVYKQKEQSYQFKKLGRKAKDSRRSCKDFVRSTPFIREEIPSKLFKISYILLVISRSEKDGAEDAASLLEKARAIARSQLEAANQAEAQKIREVVTRWLDAEKEGGSEVNWQLASTRLKNDLLKDFPAESRTEATFIDYFNEGEAHARLVSYEVLDVFILSDTQGLVSLKTLRRDIEGKDIPQTSEELPLVKEGENWLVDGVGF